MAPSRVTPLGSRFGSVLRRVRVAQGLKQKDLAQLAGVSPGTVSQAELGHPPNLTSAVAICRALGLSLDEMTGVKPVVTLSSCRKCGPAGRTGPG